MQGFYLHLQANKCPLPSKELWPWWGMWGKTTGMFKSYCKAISHVVSKRLKIDGESKQLFMLRVAEMITRTVARQIQ